MASSSFNVESLESRQLCVIYYDGYAAQIGQDRAINDFPQLTGAGETVIIIDHGVDYNHPSLGHGFGNKVIGGYDFIDNDSDPDVGDSKAGKFEEPHGTGVAGVIAADRYIFNGRYHQGIAPGVKIIALRQDSSIGVRQSLDWVIAHFSSFHNLAAINITDFLGAGHFPTAYDSEINKLASLGVFMSTPVGNGDLPIENPATNPNVFGVGGTDATGNVWKGSRRGPAMKLIAPADGVTITYDSPTYQPIYTYYGEGTSWASADAAGVAVLIKQINQKFTPRQIASILVDSGHQVYDPVSKASYPRLDVDAALKLAYQRSGVIVDPGGPGPQPEAPYKVPAFRNGLVTIQAENYDVGGEGVAYHDSDNINKGNTYRLSGVDVFDFKTGNVSGVYVGSTLAGEYLNYTVSIPKTGKYNLSFVVASSGKGGTFHMSVDGTNSTSALTVPNTKGNAKFVTITKKNVQITAGKHVLQLAFDTTGPSGFVGHFDSFSIKAVTAKTK